MAQTDARNKLAHDLRNVVNNISLNLEVAQRLAARAPEARAEELRQHLQVASSELKKLKQMIEKAGKDFA